MPNLKTCGDVKRQMSYSVLFCGAELESIVENHKEVQTGENLVMRTVREWTKSHEVQSRKLE